MHKLQRGDDPACLDHYRHGEDRWETFVRDGQTPAVWAALEQMQGARCAYCEGSIGPGRRHIDHFRQKDTHRFPQGTFRWDNLFGSCVSDSSCGLLKDRCGNYDHALLIKPDIDDPDEFFVFVTDGTIALKPNLDARNAQRASETLRILGLNPVNGRLRNERRRAVAGYLQTAQELRELSQIYPQEDWLPFLLGELARIRDEPFCTAIRHALTSQQTVGVSQI